MKVFLDGRVTVHQGDARDILKTIPDDSIDAIVTDPPYAFESIVKRFGKPGAAPTRDGDVYARSSAGFMYRDWDTGDTVFAPSFWGECLRVLKPGGHCLAFGATRYYHRLGTALENAGFDIRDTIMWTYSTGFPKSHDAGHMIAKRGVAPEIAEAWDGWGTALKPAVEPIVVARKALKGKIPDNVLAYGTGTLNIDRCRAPDERWPANLIHDGSDEVVAAFPAGAARFFHSPKASKKEKVGGHPTQKPIALMQYLVRLVTPPGGTVLDPFAGTGTTGEACWREGFGSVLIERESDYADLIEERMRTVRKRL